MGMTLDLDGANGAIMRAAFNRVKGPALAAALDEFGNYKVSRLVRNFVRGGVSIPGSPPGTRSGQLRHSITYLVIFSPTGRRLQVGTTSVYGAKLDIGGKIVPRIARALTVPISPLAIGKRARDFQNTFIGKRGTGDTIGIIFQKNASGPPTALFALRTRVTILARPWLFWEPADELKLLTILKRHGERS